MCYLRCPWGQVQADKSPPGCCSLRKARGALGELLRCAQGERALRSDTDREASTLSRELLMGYATCYQNV